MGRSQDLSGHFDRIASRYPRVRDTDPVVVETIVSHLPRRLHPVDVADIGCGTGRYTDILARRCACGLRIFCCDYSIAMLTECSKRMRLEFPNKDIHYCRVCANDLPFADGSLDAVITFNAVHHFNLDLFVAEASRVLQTGGLLSIYTRTPEQNAHTIWGQYFPGFTERETRLYRSEQLEAAIGLVSGLQLEGIQVFRNTRAESVKSLLNRARSYHYSTFVLYPEEEFEIATGRFADKLSKLSQDGRIEHTAENTLVLARRQATQLWL